MSSFVGLLWWVTGEFLTIVFGIAIAGTFYGPYAQLSLAVRRGKARQNWRPFRFSIGQIMVVTLVAAGYLALLRGLFTIFPAREPESVTLVSLGALAAYATFGFPVWKIWIGLRNLRAIRRKHRATLAHYSSVLIQQENRRNERRCVKDPGSPSAGA